MQPIFVPSKNRPNSSTCRLLAEAGLRFCVVVEPQDATRYPSHWQQIVLPHNDRGLPFVRQFLLERAEGWFWMLDDDITAFFAVRERRCVRESPDVVLESAENNLVGLPGLVQGALEYQQFAWSAARSVKLGGYCDVAVLINGPVCRSAGIRYRKEMELKEDRDLTLQCLAAGFVVARATHCAFACPRNGSNAGGLEPLYAQSGREAEACRRMAEAWPGICEPIVKPSGRSDVKIRWGRISPPTARAAARAPRRRAGK